MLKKFEEACKQGKVDASGCYGAASLYDEKAKETANPAESQDMARAIEYYALACRGGHDRGCQKQLRLRLPPVFYQTPGKGPKPSLPPADEAKLAERVPPLEAACHDEKNGRACKLLGDLLIGKDTAKAKEAYERSCKLASSSLWCEHDLAGEGARADALKAKCDEKSALGCHCLAKLVGRVDPPRAALYAAKTCELRGADGKACYAQTYFDLPDLGKDPFTRRPAPSPSGLGNRGRTDLADPCLAPPVPLSKEQLAALDEELNISIEASVAEGMEAEAVQAGVEAAKGQLLQCYQKALETNEHLLGTVSLRFTVDPSGEIEDVTNAGSDVPSAMLISCMVGQVQWFDLPKPSGKAAAVVLTMKLSRAK